jgi:hypothetical protein
MAKDRFAKTYSKSKKFQEGVSKTFNNTNVAFQPVRKFDECWTTGRYKGLHITAAPKSYIGWVLDKWKGLTADQRNLLNRYL